MSQRARGSLRFSQLSVWANGGEVVATDLSAKMVESVRVEAGRRGVTNMSFERVDAEELAYEDNSFDVALCVLGMMYPADPQRAIEQMLRVLRPGGRAAVCVWGRRDRCGWNEIFPIIDAQVNSDVCPMFFSLGAPGALKYSFETAGFTNLREERHDMTLRWRDDEDACGAIFPGGPVALPYSKFDAPTRAAVPRRVSGVARAATAATTAHTRSRGEFAYMLAGSPASR